MAGPDDVITMFLTHERGKQENQCQRKWDGGSRDQSDEIAGFEDGEGP